MKRCSVTECDRPFLARGMCSRHYQEARAAGMKTLAPKTLEERLWAKVEKTDTCWLWRGYRDRNGYGQIKGSGRAVVLVHRASFELCVGPIPTGLVLDHLCRNTSCVNPDHLEPVAQRVNVLRGIGPSAHQAQQTHCVRGHELAGDNLVWTAAGKKRRCRKCMALHSKARRSGVHIEQLVCEQIERAEGWAS